MTNTLSQVWRCGLASVLAATLVGCASVVLPKGSEQQESPWTDYDGVKEAYDSVTPGKTNLDDLRAQGFDPGKTPNISILNYLDVVQRFSPILDKTDLPPGVQACIAAREECYAYVVAPSSIHRERKGNVALDLLGFRRKTHITGWKFEALFVMIDDKVVYKIWNGTPEIRGYDDDIKPLGPLQSIDLPAPY